MGLAARCLVPLRRAVAATAGALVLGAIAPVAAEATTTCEYDGAAEVLKIAMSADNDSVILRLIAPETIDVRESGGLISCSGGTPTAANTEFITVSDNSGNGSTRLTISEAPNLAGVGVIYTSGGGNLDTLQILSVPAAPSQFLAGAAGVSTNGDSTKDITLNFLSPIPESIVLLGSTAADTISARGGGSTGSPVSGTSLELRGEPGNDTLEGGEAGDLLNGDLGNDTLRGFGGEDALVGDGLAESADDLYDGGAAADTVRYPLVLSGVTVDLAKTGPQATGNGNDSFVSVENVDGSSFADTLLGDAGRNALNGQNGDDIVDGRGGDDPINGGSGSDTVTFAEAPAAVVVNLETGKASGGYGNDSLPEFENLIGSPFADSLTGSAADNQITGLGGADVVQALGGADRVDVRDGVADNASCGSEVDTAISDRLSLDTIQADCEIRDALPEPAGPGGGGNPGGGNAPGSGNAGAGGGKGGGGKSGGNGDTSVRFSLRGAKRQALLAQGGLVLKLRCPQEACNVTVRGGRRLKPVTVHLTRGATKTVKLKIRKAKLPAIRSLLLGGGRLKLRVSASASDAAGNTAPAQLVVRAQRPRSQLS
jgi:Ca2+-binding RTX toxin-like protein